MRGFAKEIDHLLARVTAIEEHLGIDRKIAAQGTLDCRSRILTKG